MAKYSVGQRVRIVRVTNPANQHLIGAESHVIHIRYVEHWLNKPDKEPAEAYLLPVQAAQPGSYWTSDQLEPIIPDGAKPSEFKDVNELLDSLQLEEVVK